MANSVDHAKNRISILALMLFVLLACSVAVNFFLWRWSDTQTQHAANAQARLLSTQAELRTQAEQALLMKSMLGLGALTKAEMDVLKQAATGDPDIDVIVSNFSRDMDLLGSDVEFPNRNYATLSSYLNVALTNCRSANEAARESAQAQDR